MTRRETKRIGREEFDAALRGESSLWVAMVLRPLARRLGPLIINRTELSPVQMSLIGLSLAVVAAALFLVGSRPALILGALLAQGAVLADYLDGPIARLKRSGSPRGAALDNFADLARLLMLSLALTLTACSQGPIGAAAAGACLFLFAGLADAWIPRIVRDVARCWSPTKRAGLTRVDRVLLRWMARLERRGLRLVLYGFNEREAVAFFAGPLVGLCSFGLILSGLLALPFLALRFRLDLALLKQQPQLHPGESRDQTIVVVGAGFFQRPVLEAARREGYRTVAVDRDPNAPGAQLADEVLPVSAHDPKTALEGLRALSSNIPPIAGVVSAGARGCIHTAAVLADGFGVPGIDPECARTISDKGLLRARMAEFGLNTLPFRITESSKEVAPLLAQGSIVLKPLSTSGGRGVTLVKDVTELDRSWEKVREVEPSGPLLAEEYAPGRDVGVTALAQEGRVTVVCTVDKHLTTDAIFGRPSRLVAPSSLEPDRLGEIGEVVQRAASRLGVGVGPFYAELRVPEIGQPQVIEVEAAVPGSLIAQYLVPASTGRDYVTACIQAATGQKFPDSWAATRTAACLFEYEPAALLSVDELSVEPLPLGPLGGPARALLLKGQRSSVRRLLAQLIWDDV